MSAPRQPDMFGGPDTELDDCWACDGEGVTYSCFDGFCEDAEYGCDECAQTCDICRGSGFLRAPATDADRGRRGGLLQRD